MSNHIVDLSKFDIALEKAKYKCEVLKTGASRTRDQVTIDVLEDIIESIDLLANAIQQSHKTNYDN